MRASWNLLFTYWLTAFCYFYHFLASLFLFWDFLTFHFLINMSWKENSTIVKQKAVVRSWKWARINKFCLSKPSHTTSASLLLAFIKRFKNVEAHANVYLLSSHLLRLIKERKISFFFEIYFGMRLLLFSTQFSALYRILLLLFIICLLLFLRLSTFQFTAFLRL